jgi:DNA-binding beta-propeller fold protein YncE
MSPRFFAHSLLSVLFLVACGADKTSQSPGGAPGASGAPGADAGGGRGAVPELGTTTTPKITVVATSKDGLNVPRDLEFDPMHDDQLWVANTATNGVVIFTNPGTSEQTADIRTDAYAQHFMDHVSSIAFGVSNRFASCQESRDPWEIVTNSQQAPDDYMGPTLWLADLDVFAKQGQTFPWDPTKPQGSHVDMLHESPWCMGIAWDHDNAYWAADGLHGQIVFYDFVKDHGPGGWNHSDGVVRRYPDATIERVAEIPTHMVLDHTSGMLYIADAGGGRVTRLDTKTGSAPSPLSNAHEVLAEFSEVTGATYDQIVGGLGQPTGIELAGGHLLVSDASNGRVFGYDLEGNELARIETGATTIAGLAVGPDGHLWFADSAAGTLNRVDP